MQQGEGKPATGPHQAGDGRKQPVEVIDIRQAKVAHRAVEHQAVKYPRTGGVGVQVVDAQWLGPLLGPRLGQHRRRDIQPGDHCAAARQFPGDPALPAGHIHQSHPADLAGQPE
jgi:hypothetical protein